MNSNQLHDALHAREWQKCAPDWDTSTTRQKVEAFMYFCENYGHIKHPSKGKIPFVLRDAQMETVESFLENRYSIVLKARQIGFSTLVSIYCFWLAFFYPDRHVIMLSRTEREAAKLLSHAKYVHTFMPDWMRFIGPILNWTQKGVGMTNNSAVESMPSANDPARGSTAHTIVVDEIAFLPNSDEAWASIEPVADVGGRVIMLSTANGEGNLFHTLWNGSQTGSGTGSQFKGIFFPWWASDRDDDWYEAKKAELPEWQLAQEYPSNPEEAFLKSGRPVFDLEILRALETSDPKKGRLHRTPDGVEFIEDGGQLSVWERPDPTGTYAIGADVAFGLEHGDFSSAHVINARTGSVCATWHGHADPDLFAENVLVPLGEWYNNALLGAENNNHGLAVVRTIQRVGYRNQYKARTFGKKKMTKTETLGWNTNHTTKYLLVDELNKAIRDGSLGLSCVHTIAELRTFVREGDGKMHGSPHDDRVISLGIAVQMLKFAWLPEYRPKKVKPGPGTWGALVSYAFRNERNSGQKRTAIGTHSTRHAA